MQMIGAMESHDMTRQAAARPRRLRMEIERRSPPRTSTSAKNPVRNCLATDINENKASDLGSAKLSRTALFMTLLSPSRNLKFTRRSARRPPTPGHPEDMQGLPKKKGFVPTCTSHICSRLELEF